MSNKVGFTNLFLAYIGTLYTKFNYNSEVLTGLK
jgi:hypothetical protein